MKKRRNVGRNVHSYKEQGRREEGLVDREKQKKKQRKKACQLSYF